MVDEQKPGSLSNVFGLSSPQHIYTKMMVDIWALQDASSVWAQNKPYPEPLFAAFNLAVTIWHMTDWLWMSSPANRQMLAKKYRFDFTNQDEFKKGGLDKGLKKFQDAVRLDCEDLNVCEEIANASKHMRRRTTNPNIKAVVEWELVTEDMGYAKKGDKKMSLAIHNGEEKKDATLVFIDAAGYWERLMLDNKLFSEEDILDQKIKKGEAAPIVHEGDGVG